MEILYKMKRRRFITLILFMCFWFIVEGFSAGAMNSGIEEDARKDPGFLWQKFAEYPTRENAEKFYDLICKTTKSQIKDLSGIVDSYRFSSEVIAGNRAIVLAALRLSTMAEEKQATHILRLIGKLCRINPILFLEVLAEAHEFLGERIRNIVVSLPEEHEYLFDKSLLSEELSDLLSYFACYELTRRYEALSLLKGKKIFFVRKARDICLEELSKKREQMNCNRYAEYGDDEISRRLISLWNLPAEDKWLIFDTPLARHERIFEVIKDDYYEHILYSMFEYEIFTGNARVLDAMTTDVKVSIFSARENTLWELSRIRPDLFLLFIYKQDTKKIDKKGKIDFLSSYTFLGLDPLIKIIELDHRIRGLSKIKNSHLTNIKNECIKLMKRLTALERRRLNLKR